MKTGIGSFILLALLASSFPAPKKQVVYIKEKCNCAIVQSYYLNGKLVRSTVSKNGFSQSGAGPREIYNLESKKWELTDSIDYSPKKTYRK